MDLEPRDTVRGNPLQVAVARLLTEYDLILVHYPVEVWMPRRSRAFYRPDWPQQVIKEQPLSIRLPEISAPESGGPVKFVVASMKAEIVLSPTDLTTNLQMTRTEEVDPIQAIKEARKEA